MLKVSVLILALSALSCSKATDPASPQMSSPGATPTASGTELPNSETMPATPNVARQAAPKPSFKTLIVGKWRTVGQSLTQVSEFTKEGIVNRTAAISGTAKANDFIPKDEPITLGSISQSGTYTFVNDKSIHVARKEASSGGISTPATEFDADLMSITATELVGKIGTAEWRLNRQIDHRLASALLLLAAAGAGAPRDG